MKQAGAELGQAQQAKIGLYNDIKASHSISGKLACGKLGT